MKNPLNMNMTALSDEELDALIRAAIEEREHRERDVRIREDIERRRAFIREGKGDPGPARPR